MQQRFNPLQPSGHYMYRQFNIQQLYVLPTQCTYVFCMGLRTTPLFPYTALTDWFFITETYSVYCAVRTASIIQVTLQITDRAKWTVADFSPRRPGFKPGPVICDICGVQTGSGTVCPPSTSVSLFQYYSTNAPYLSSFTRFSYHKDKRAKSGNLWKAVACSLGDTEAVDKHFFLGGGIMRFSIQQ